MAVIKILCLLICLPLACFTGCQSHKRPIPKGENHVLGDDQGYLVGSFAYSGRHPGKLAKLLGDDFRYNAYGFYFRSVDYGSDFSGNIGMSGDPWFATYRSDFKGREGQGKVFAIPVPAGRYEFYNFSFYLNSGAFQNTFSSRNDFSFPFEVKAGECIYIGEVAALHEFGKNMLGMTVPSGGYHVFFDEGKRDIPLLREKYPFLADYDISYVDVFGGSSSRVDVAVATEPLDESESNVRLQMLELIYKQGQITEEQYTAKRAQLLQIQGAESGQ